MTKSILLTAAVCSAIAGSASAVTFDGTAIGSWQNVTASITTVKTVSNNDAGALAVIEFGKPVKGSYTSKFTFDGVGSDGDPGFNADTGVPFKLGDFVYRNGDNKTGTSQLTGAQLNVLVGLTSPIFSSENYLFDFNLTITPNTGNPLTDPDVVTVSQGLLQDSFNYNGHTYTLKVLGFSKDGGNTFVNDFTGGENTSNGAELYARIVATPDGGATAMLLGIGALGIAGLRRKLS